MLAVNSNNRTIDQVEKDNLGNLALEKERNTFSVAAQEPFTLVSKVSMNSAASQHSLLTKLATVQVASNKDGGRVPLGVAQLGPFWFAEFCLCNPCLDSARTTRGCNIRKSICCSWYGCPSWPHKYTVD